MNRKLLHGFLAAAVLIGGAVSVTSCKDTDEDMFVQLKSENLTLQEKVRLLEEAKTKLQEDLKKCQQDCKAKWDALTNNGQYSGSFDQMLNQYIQSIGQHQTIQWYLDQIDGALTGKDKDGNDKTFDSLGDRLGEIDLAIEALRNYEDVFGSMDDIKDALGKHDTTFPEVIDAAMHGDSLAQANKAILDALLDGYEYDGKNTDAIKGLMKNAAETADSALGIAWDAKKLADRLVLSVDSLKDSINDIKKGLAALELRVKANEEKIDTLNNRVLAITGQFNKLVTGIVIQQVTNPVFGKINLPLDVKSGILMAYFGEGDVTFPAVNSSAIEFDSKTNWISATDQANAGIRAEQISGVYGVTDGKLNLGSIYLTVNPANLDVTGANWQLVNSKGENDGVELSPLEKSDELLMFGVGRAADVPNGFYKTTASYPVSDIADLDNFRFSVTDDFKSNVSSMLKSHNLSDVAGITKLIFDQFNNRFAAYGVRAWWEYQAYDETTNAFTDGVNATYSDFSLAATAVRPLSYKFLYGKSFRQIGTISPIQDFNLTDDINIQVPTFSFNFGDVPFNFTFGDITVSLAGTEIEVTVPRTPVYDNDGNEIGYIDQTTAKATDLSGLEAAISAAVSESLQSQDAKLQEAFTHAMTEVASRINAQLNSEMSKFQTNINDQFKDIMNSIQNKVNGYLGTVNKYINKVNGLIKRANRILKDPNHYLQVTMLFEGNDGELRQVSNSAALPSYFKLDGGDGLKLFATSFNGDLLVPSYKKYVAVTNAYVTGDKTKAPVASVIAAANANTNWNEVIDGTTTELALQLQSGYTYEIVYSSLDFHGVASTRKFYVTAE